MKFNLLLFLFLSLSSNLYCQEVGSIKKSIIKNDKDLKEEIRKLIRKDFMIDASDDYVKAAFTLKIDSLGEVRSAHIRWSKNIKVLIYYSICSKIEENFNLLFLYDRLKKGFSGEKYVICMFPYKNSLDDND